MAEEAVRQTGKVPEAMQSPSNGDPYVQRGQDADITSPTFDALLQGMVENARDESKVIHDASPTVLNAHATYADSLRFEAEQQVLFRESPVIVGLSGDLPNPNDYRRFEVAGKSMLLTRDSTGKFRAFENACRHRGMELVSSEAPSGNKRLHVCPYHAWSYGSDGSLMSIPFEEGFTDEAGAHASERGGLVALPAAERAGLLWVMATKVDDATFEQLLGEVLPPELESELELCAWLSRSVFHFCPSVNLTRLHVCQVWAWGGTTSNFTRHDDRCQLEATNRHVLRVVPLHKTTPWPQRSGETCARVLHAGTRLRAVQVLLEQAW